MLSSEQVSGPIVVHVHSQRHFGPLSWRRQHAPLVLRQVSTRPPELCHVTASWHFRGSCATLHCFRDVNPVLSDITSTSSPRSGTKTTLMACVSRSSLSVLFFISPDMWRTNASYTNQFHVFRRIFSKLRDSLQSHPAIFESIMDV